MVLFRFVGVFLFFITVAIFSPVSANEAMPVSFQAQLTKNGELMNGSHTVILEVFDDENNRRWSKSYEDIEFTDGNFSITVDFSQEAFSPSIFSSDSAKIRFKINEDSTEIPVNSVLRSLYAYKAADVEDNSISKDKLQANSV